MHLQQGTAALLIMKRANALLKELRNKSKAPSVGQTWLEALLSTKGRYFQ